MNDLFLIVLKDAGLSDFWIEIAEDMGQEKFLSMWKKLSENSTPGVSIQVRLPKFERYERYRRDRYIRYLYERGMSKLKIMAQLQYEHGKAPGLRQIHRIAKNR